MMENSAGNFRLSITFVSFVFFFFLIIFVQCLKNMGGCEVPGGSFPVIPLLSLQYDRGMLVQKGLALLTCSICQTLSNTFLIGHCHY